jgi:hypothetical protein
MTVKHLRGLQKQKLSGMINYYTSKINIFVLGLNIYQFHFLLVASNNDPVVMAKYKLGYSECVQECINFMNNNTNNSSSNSQFQMSNPNIDQFTRHRLISNLVRQYQQTPAMVNGIAQPTPTGINLPNQQQIEQFLKENQQQQLQLQKQQQNQLAKSPDSDEIDIQSLSPNSELRGLRRSSVSPISGASSECSSSSNNNYFSMLNNSSSSSASSSNNSSSNEPEQAVNSPSFESFNENMHEEPSSPIDASDEAEKDNCWRPW